MRPGGFKCCWYEDSNIARQPGALAEVRTYFSRHSLRIGAAIPMLRLRFRGAILEWRCFQEAPLSKSACCGACPAFSSDQTSACEKAVHKLCTAWAQHIGVPPPFPSTAT